MNKLFIKPCPNGSTGSPRTGLNGIVPARPDPSASSGGTASPAPKLVRAKLAEGCEWRKFRYSLILVLAWCANLQANELQKVYHHILTPDHTELAKIVFYFSHEPAIRDTQMAVADHRCDISIFSRVFRLIVPRMK